MTTQISGDTGVSQCQPNSVSQDDLQSGVVGKGPVFSAVQSSAQTIGSSQTKVSLQTEQFDSNNNYDTGTSKFTPTVAGYYWINAAIASGVSATVINLLIYKNGAADKVLNNSTSATVNQVSGGALVLLNGTTDYVEIFASFAVSQNTNPGVISTYFQGHLVRAA